MESGNQKNKMIHFVAPVLSLSAESLPTRTTSLLLTSPRSLDLFNAPHTSHPHSHRSTSQRNTLSNYIPLAETTLAHSLSFRFAPRYPHNTAPPISVVSRPLRSLNELDIWQPGEDPLNVSSVPLCRRPSDGIPGPKVIHCHDMAGGYLEDRHSLGGQDFNTYHFHDWQFIDYFVYFSHCRVTIPRMCLSCFALPLNTHLLFSPTTNSV